MTNAQDRLLDPNWFFRKWRRKKAIRELAELPGTEGVKILVEALGEFGTRELLEEEPSGTTDLIISTLRQLDPAETPEKVDLLWDIFRDQPCSGVADVVEVLGWPRSTVIDSSTAAAFLAVLDGEQGVCAGRAVATFARAIPLSDGDLNDLVFAAWNRCGANIETGAEDLEEVITAQRRKPADPVLEALFALVVGDLDRYQAMRDTDGTLFAKAFEMAPNEFRERIKETVAAARDNRAVLIAYRHAQQCTGIDRIQRLDNLKYVGDHDGMFEALRGLRLINALPLCEFWAGSDGRPSDDRRREAVDIAVEAYMALGNISDKPDPELPDGMIDLFAYWRDKSDFYLHPNKWGSGAGEDPFTEAGNLYLRFEIGDLRRSLGSVEDDDIMRSGAGISDHWPVRLIARLSAYGDAGDELRKDHVLWVNAVSDSAWLLQVPLDVGLSDLRKFSARLKQACDQSAIAVDALFRILNAFRDAFDAGAIVGHKIDGELS